MAEILNDQIRNVYFLGIGGIGMSALARYFKAKGYEVGGYDRTPSPLTRLMQEKEGFPISYRDEEEEIALRWRDPETTLVVYTPAIPSDNRQMNFFLRAGFTLHKRAEVLGMISRLGKAICVAGTHGKTTVSTMTAYLLHHSGVGCSAFLGGISANFNSNLLLDPHSPYIVIEADEFDRSFLHLSPEMAVITAIDADHLDIYGDKAHVEEAFVQFTRCLQPGGQLLLKAGLSLDEVTPEGTYGVETASTCHADRLRMEDGRFYFDYHGCGYDIPDLELGVPGRLNVENVTAAITLALKAGVQPEEIRKSLPGFKGVVRRFNIHFRSRQAVYIDDYAHHPKEIEATLLSVKEVWPDQPVTVIFQPHLYTRTRDFYPDFARSLSLADRVILLDIYPAREEPLPGITSGIILEKLTVPAEIMRKDEVLDWVAGPFRGGILLTMGAGDIDRMVGRIREVLEKRGSLS